MKIRISCSLSSDVPNTALLCIIYVSIHCIYSCICLYDFLFVKKEM